MRREYVIGILVSPFIILISLLILSMLIGLTGLAIEELTGVDIIHTFIHPFFEEWKTIR